MVEPFDYTQFFTPTEIRKRETTDEPFDFTKYFLAKKNEPETDWGSTLVDSNSVLGLPKNLWEDNEVVQHIAAATDMIANKDMGFWLKTGKVAGEGALGLLGALDWLFGIAEIPFSALVEGAAGAAEAADHESGALNTILGFLGGFIGGVFQTAADPFFRGKVHHWSGAIEHLIKTYDPEYEMGALGTIASEAFNPVNWVTFGGAAVAKAAMYSGKTVRGLAKIGSKIGAKELKNAVVALEQAGYVIEKSARAEMLAGDGAKVMSWLAKVEELDKLYANGGLSTLMKRAIKRAAKKTEKQTGVNLGIKGLKPEEVVGKMIPKSLESTAPDSAAKIIFIKNLMDEFSGFMSVNKKFRGWVSGIESLAIESPFFVVERTLSGIASKVPVVGRTLEKKMALFGSELTMPIGFVEEGEKLVPVTKMFGPAMKNVKIGRIFKAEDLARYMDEARAKQKWAAKKADALKRVEQKLAKGLELTAEESKLIRQSKKIEKYSKASLEDIAFGIAAVKEPGSAPINKAINVIVHKIISRPFVKAETFTEKIAAAEIRQLAQKGAAETQEVEAYYNYLEGQVSKLAKEYSERTGKDYDSVRESMLKTIDDIIETRVTERISPKLAGEKYIDADLTAIEFANKIRSNYENGVDVVRPIINESIADAAVKRGALTKSEFRETVTNVWTASGVKLGEEETKTILDNAYDRYVSYIVSAKRKAASIREFTKVTAGLDNGVETLVFQITDSRLSDMLGIEDFVVKGKMAGAAMRGEISMKDVFSEVAARRAKTNQAKMLDFLNAVKSGDADARRLYDSVNDLFRNMKKYVLDDDVRKMLDGELFVVGKKRMVSDDFITTRRQEGVFEPTPEMKRSKVLLQDKPYVGVMGLEFDDLGSVMSRLDRVVKFHENKKVASGVAILRKRVLDKVSGFIENEFGGNIATVNLEKLNEFIRSNRHTNAWIEYAEFTNSGKLRFIFKKSKQKWLAENRVLPPMEFGVDGWYLWKKTPKEIGEDLAVEMKSLGYAIRNTGIEHAGTVSFESVVKSSSEPNTISKLLADETQKGIYRVVVEGEKGYYFKPVEKVYVRDNYFGVSVGSNKYHVINDVTSDGRKIKIVLRKVRIKNRSRYDAFVVDADTWDVIPEINDRLGLGYNLSRDKYEKLAASFAMHMPPTVSEVNVRPFIEKSSGKRPVIIVSKKHFDKVEDGLHIINGRYVGAAVGSEIPEEAFVSIPMLDRKRMASINGELYFVDTIKTKGEVSVVIPPHKYKVEHKAVKETLKSKPEEFIVLRKLSSVEKQQLVCDFDKVLDIVEPYAEVETEAIRLKIAEAIHKGNLSGLLDAHNELVSLVQGGVIPESLAPLDEVLTFYGKKWYFDATTGEVKTINGGVVNNVVKIDGEEINSMMRTVAPHVSDRSPELANKIIREYVELAKSNGEYRFISNESLADIMKLVENSDFDIETFSELFDTAMKIKRSFADIHAASEVSNLQADMLSDDFIDYLSRIMTPEARDAFTKAGIMEYDAQKNIYKFKTDEIKEKLLHREAFRGVKLNELNARAKEGLVFRPNIEVDGKVIQVLDNPALAGKDIFLEDPMKIYATRMRKTVRAVAKKRIVSEFLKNKVWAREVRSRNVEDLFRMVEEETKYHNRSVVVVATDESVGSIAKPIARKMSPASIKFYEDLLTEIDMRGAVEINIGKARQILGDKLASKLVDAPGIYIVERSSYRRLLDKIDEHIYLAKEMEKQHKSPLVRGFFATHSILKSALLLSTKYHANNTYGLIQMSGEIGQTPYDAASRAAHALLHIIKPIKSGEKTYADFSRTMYTITGKAIKQGDIIKAYNSSSVAGNGMFAMLAALKKRESSMVAKIPGVNVATWLLNKNSAFGSAVDDAFRYQAFEALILNGYSVKEAEETVLKAFYNYRALTGSERSMSLILPFYAFARMNIPYQLTRMVQRPWRLALYRYAVKDEDLVYQNNVDAWSLPLWVDKDPKSGHTILRLWRMGGRVLMADVQNINTPKDVAQYFFGSLHPILKLPFELTFNKRAFGILEDKTGLSFRKIYDETRTTKSKAAVYVDHILQSLARPYADFRRTFLTQAYTNGRLEQDMNRITMPWMRNANEEYLHWESLIINKIASFASANMDFIDVDKRHANRIRELIRDVEDLRVKHNLLMRSQISHEKLERSTKQIHKKLDELYKAIKRANARFKDLKKGR